MNWDKFVKDTELVYIRQAMWYGFDRESAEDLTYDTYLAILEREIDPAFNLGYTIMKHSCLNEIRNNNSRTGSSMLIREHELPMGAKRRMLLDEFLVSEGDIVSGQDFDEVIEYTQLHFPGDDYTLLMMRAYGVGYAELSKKFHISVGQAKRRMRLMRKHLYARFPRIFS